MSIFTLGISKPRKFNHVPIYYDPEKEKLKDKRQENSGKRINFHKNLEDSRARKKEMFRLALLLLMLIALALFLLFNGAQMWSLYFD